MFFKHYRFYIHNLFTE
ncbi:hypothetical protein Patl1_03981 [Pistacia atlantica]|uniref:Uncharacterized protein n=1 Tax=Pistacia atlantica TaxID=434234 RepID=A0ACC1BTV3_9ROSI|nr:hypothetical protein Patl1_03981 [Pistacia atlantica]